MCYCLMPLGRNGKRYSFTVRHAAAIDYSTNWINTSAMTLAFQILSLFNQPLVTLHDFAIELILNFRHKFP